MTDDEIVSSLFLAEEEEDDDESSPKFLPIAFTKDAIVALETAFNKVTSRLIKSLSCVEEKCGIAKQKQIRIDSFVAD